MDIICLMVFIIIYIMISWFLVCDSIPLNKFWIIKEKWQKTRGTEIRPSFLLFNKNNLLPNLLLVKDANLRIAAVEAFTSVVPKDEVSSLSKSEGDNDEAGIVGLEIVEDNFIYVYSSVVNVHRIVWYPY